MLQVISTVHTVTTHHSLTLPGKKGDCTISIKDSDFMDMVSGKLNGQKVWCGSLVIIC